MHLRLGGLQPLGKSPLLFTLPVTSQGHFLDPLLAEATGRLLDIEQRIGRHQMDYHAVGTVREQRPLPPLGRCKFTT